MTRTNPGTKDLSVEEAQSRFRALVDNQRERALWHLRPEIEVDISGGGADAILDSIINHGDRAAWIQAKELKRWRSQHSR